MQYSLLALALAASAVAQGVTSAIAPQSSAPAGCVSTYSSSFEIQVLNVTTTKRDLQKRGPVIATLNNGVLKDSQGRTGYIAANYQFQFDGPPQTGAIYTAGWSICSNGSLALGGSAIFYECLSGTFYNLYDQSVGGQCAPIYIDVIPVGGNQAASQLPDGQITANPVTQISDGQVQQPTGVVTQISDGQIQQPTGVITQISDGQIQNPTGVVTQISDGQIQNPTGVVTQISDGQIQGPTGAIITQISDGQIQATTKPVNPITQISDGQIQAPPATGTAPSARPSASKNLTTPITPSQPVTGASPNAATTSATVTGGIFAVVALVFALAML